MPTLCATWNEPGQVALAAAIARYVSGGDILTAIEHGLAVAEDDPHLVAIGRGSVPNQDGEIELDAAVMEGRELNAGAVCALKGILPAVTVARMVMERTDHILLAAEEARRFALAQGLKHRNLLTAESLRRYEEWKSKPENRGEYVHTSHDTITMLGLENSHFVAASSTSGLSYKLPGRVGDSPIVGAGIYADDEVGAAGATGWGEELLKACASFRTVEAMRRGMTPQEACEHTIRHMIRRQPKSTEIPCVVLALDRSGEPAAALTKGTFHLWVWKGGEPERRTYQGLAD